METDHNSGTDNLCDQPSTSNREESHSPQKKKLKSANRPALNWRPGLDPIYEKPRGGDPIDMSLLYMHLRFKREDEFISFIWDFPGSLYLSDTQPNVLPTVQHEGGIYNLMHVAVLLNCPTFCQLILDMLQHPLFAKTLFRSKIQKDHSVKMMDIVYLYLNSGCEETGDTPLHFAAKYGFEDCCKVLLSHPLCQPALRNYAGLCPSDQICLTSFKRIQKCFTDGLLYIPVYRSNQDLQPFIGKPRLCRSFAYPEFEHGSTQTERKFYFLNGFAGPMSSEMAQIFYNILKNPSSSSLLTSIEKEQLSEIMVSEPDSGIERIARHFSKNLEIEWKEFVPGLKIYTNLNDNEGVIAFEQYWEVRRQCPHHCCPLPSPVDEGEQKNLPLALVRRYPPIINPLCHRVNSFYSYHQKCFEAEDEDVAEIYRGIIAVPSSPELHGREETPKIIYSEDDDIFMDRWSLTAIDKNVYVSLKDIDTTLYPETQRWKMKMAAQLQLEKEKFPGRERFDPLNPIPVPNLNLDSVSEGKKF